MGTDSVQFPVTPARFHFYGNRVAQSLSEGSACSPIRLRLESGLNSGLPRME